MVICNELILIANLIISEKKRWIDLTHNPT